MEKDNKYYEVIKNLVENNKKYVDYEEILDDIIDDVYSHSQTVLNSIIDEGVIEGYLNKVVNTSLITVPKKLGLKKKVEEAAPVYVPPVQEIKVNTEYVERMINGTVSKENKIEKQEEELPIIEDVSEEVEVSEIGNEISVEADQKVFEQEEVVDIEELQQAEENQNVFEQEDVVEIEEVQQEDDNELISIENDEDIIDGQTEYNELEQIDEPKEFEPSDIFEVSNDIGINEPQIESEKEENSSVIDIEDRTVDDVVELNTEEQESSEEIFEAQYDDVETIDLVDAEDSDNVTLNSMEVDFENDASEELSTSDLSVGEEFTDDNFVDDLINIAEDNVLEGDSDSILTEDIKEDGLSLLQEDFSSDLTENVEFADEISVNEVASTNENLSKRKVVDFSSLEKELNQENVFSFNNEEITNKLNKLVASQTTLDLAKVYDLKYNKNLGIEQIASQLGITEDAVAELLKEIVDVL